MTRRKWLLTLAVFCAVLALGATFTALRWNWNTATVSPVRGEIVEAIYGLGKVKALRQHEVKIGILASVQKLFVREGDEVAEGAPLVKFTESGLFKAPFAGIVTLVAADEGETVVPQSTIVRVDDLSEKFIEVSLEQQGALRVRRGQPVEIVFESIRGEKLRGEIVALFSKNEEFLAHIKVNGLMQNVLPGMTADVAIIIGRNENALLIPVAAINNGHVIVVRDGKRNKTPVQVGGVDGQMAEILNSSISENDQIVLGKKL